MTSEKDHCVCPAKLGLIRCLILPWKGPADVYTVFKHVNEASNTNDVILAHEENHGITLRRLLQNFRAQGCVLLAGAEKRL